MSGRPSSDAWSRGVARLLAVALFGVGLGIAQPLAAQSAESSDPTRDASARAMFEEGVSFAEKGEWEGAEDRFRRALSLRASPVIAYNLASALVERGKLVEASEMLRKVVNDDKVEPTMRQSAQTLQTQVKGRIGRIAVDVRGKQPSDEVMLDGALLLDAQLGVEIPIDPGTHRVSLERQGKTLDVQTLTIGSGGTEQVTLRTPPPPTPREVAAAAVRPIESAVDSQATGAADSGATAAGPITGRWWFWAGIGAVVVGAVVVGVVVANAGGADKTEAAFKGNFTPASLRVEVAR